MNLKEIRIANNFTQAELANKCNCDRTMIGKIEKGIVNPSVRLAKAIGGVLGFDWTLFYEDTEQKGA